MEDKFPQKLCFQNTVCVLDLMYGSLPSTDTLMWRFQMRPFQLQGLERDLCCYFRVSPGFSRADESSPDAASSTPGVALWSIPLSFSFATILHPEPKDSLVLVLFLDNEDILGKCFSFRPSLLIMVPETHKIEPESYSIIPSDGRPALNTLFLNSSSCVNSIPLVSRHVFNDT